MFDHLIAERLLEEASAAASEPRNYNRDWQKRARPRWPVCPDPRLAGGLALWVSYLERKRKGLL